MEPSPAQIEAGNYKKRHIRFQGMDISIENPVGSVRSGKDKDGTPWSIQMKHHYGYIRRSIGADGDQVDCYVGPHTDSPLAYVVHQNDPETGLYDEDKVMLGFLTILPVEQFKRMCNAKAGGPVKWKHKATLADVGFSGEQMTDYLNFADSNDGDGDYCASCKKQGGYDASGMCLACGNPWAKKQEATHFSGDDEYTKYAKQLSARTHSSAAHTASSRAMALGGKREPYRSR